MTEAAARRLQEIASSQCLPYLLNLSHLRPYLDRISFVLVGSVATGLCRESSDIDIALVCDAETFAGISQGTGRAIGRPSEAEVAGRQLHYYGVTSEEIEEKMRDLDDTHLYAYGTAVILRDPQGRCRSLLARLKERAPSLRQERLEGKLDMLLRRARGLSAAAGAGDPIAAARVGLEVITRCLKVIALLDDVPFDPRKRLFATALRGDLGRRSEGPLRELLSLLGAFSDAMISDGPIAREFLAMADKLTSALSAEAARQGFRVGLEAPDRRQIAE